MMFRATLAAASVIFSASTPGLTKVWEVDALLEERGGLAKHSAATSAALVHEVLTRLQPGDALVLSRKIPLGKVSIGDVASDVQLTGGFDGSIQVTGRMRGWDIRFAGQNTAFTAEPTADLSGTRIFCSFSGGDFVDHSSGAYVAEGLGLAPRLADADAVLPKRFADPKSSPGPSIVWGLGNIKHTSFGNKVVWMPAYYVDGGGARNETQTPQVEIRGGSAGGKWLFAIEANQGSHAPVLKIYDSERTQLYHGSTEGNRHETGAIYTIINSKQVVLGMRRFYANHSPKSSWGGKPGISLRVDGGSGNIIHNLVDIGNPQAHSLVNTDKDLEMWQTFFEDKTQPGSNSLQFMVTHQGMVDTLDRWTEPVLVDNEVVLQRGTQDLLTTAKPNVPAPPAFDFQRWRSGAAKVGGLDGTVKAAASVGFQASRSARRVSQRFGSAFLAAGADPTGRRASDAAMERLLTQGGVVEIPEGTFRFERPIRPFGAQLAKTASTANHLVLLGAGPGKSILKTAEGSEFVIDLRQAHTDLLAKGASASASTTARGVSAISGITLEGGANGLAIPTDAPAVISDFEIRGFAKAGVVSATTGFVVPVEGKPCGSDNNCSDMHLFENGSFSGGDYGIYYTEFADKQGIKNVTFSNHKVAGIWARNTNLFHGWIGSCKFQNISGPGVDLSGGADLGVRYGYLTQWVTMIENCEFIECGSATRAALDYGLTDINMLANSKIITKNKDIRYGFLGSVAQISNVTIDVKTSKAAVAIRNPRSTKGSRTPATILHTVKSNGPILLVSDMPAGNGGASDNPANEWVYTSELSDPAWTGTNHYGRKWWRDNYPWAHTVLFYQSEFGSTKYDYVLTNGTGWTKDLISGTTGIGRPLARGYEPATSAPAWLFDLRGRRMENGAGRKEEIQLVPGLYLKKEKASGFQGL